MITEIGKKNSANFLVLGVNLSNNGSICLMRGGEIELYIESERITRRKWDHCIKDTLYLIEDSPDIIALTDSFWMRGDKRVDTVKDLSALKRKFPQAVIKDYRKQHHLTHAAMAFYRSGFDEASCIVADSNGSYDDAIEIETIFSAPSWEVIHKKHFHPEFIGYGRMFEQTAIQYGWDYRDAGKVMGMSAYNKIPVQHGWENRFERLIDKSLSKNIVCSGGLFLNCVANYKMLDKDINLYVEPIAHDGGTAIGAAYLATYET